MTAPATPEPLLSICIPTYNRRAYLEAGLADLAAVRARLPVEIIVSDDASSDDTAAMLDAVAARTPGMRVYKQPQRIGGFANTMFVLRAARGRFTVYHADDDRLEPDGLVEALGFMAANPDFAAFYAPVEGYDLGTQQSSGPGLHTALVDFDPQQRVELIAYIALGLIPEHAVYRTAALAAARPDPQVYWSLMLMNAALGCGKLRFAPRPFYRAITSHWPGEQRVQLFHSLMTDTIAWETFRTGLELILAGQAGVLANPEQLAKTQALIDRAVLRQQGTVLDFLASRGRWGEFVSAYRRLAVRNALPRQMPQLELIGAALAAVAGLLADDARRQGLSRAVLAGLGEVAPLLAQYLGGAGLPASVVADLDAGSGAIADGLVVVAGPAAVAAVEQRGVPAYAIRDFQALYAAHDLTGLTPPG